MPGFPPQFRGAPPINQVSVEAILISSLNDADNLSMNPILSCRVLTKRPHNPTTRLQDDSIIMSADVIAVDNYNLLYL